MARNLHMKALAEGVQTPQQMAFLRSQGRPFAQGYYYSETVSATDFAKILKKRFFKKETLLCKSAVKHGAGKQLVRPRSGCLKPGESHRFKSAMRR